MNRAASRNKQKPRCSVARIAGINKNRGDEPQKHATQPRVGLEQTESLQMPSAKRLNR
jgi:hypothetical protein